MIEIREEEPADRESVRRLNLAAFANGPEAAVVDKLRATCDGYLAFVAVESGHVVGHILFTPATIDDCDVVGMGLAPMAVVPSRQRDGIGSRLVRHGLGHLKADGCPFVIVLGHPEYYPRFGFEPASDHGLFYVEAGYASAFFVLELVPGSLAELDGEVRYHPAFGDGSSGPRVGS